MIIGILLLLVPLIFVIIATYFAYKSAKDVGRNPVIWALITFAVGFGLQFVLPFFVALILMIVLIVTGNPPLAAQEELMNWSFAINFVCIVASVVGMLFVLKYASSMPNEKAISSFPLPPTPPSDFS